IKRVSVLLTKWGVPTPRNGQIWHTGTIYRILRNPLYMGDAVVHRFRKVEGKTIARPKEEHIHLQAGLVPPIVSPEIFVAVQEQLAINKQDSLRNNTKRDHELGILRSGFCHCGICKRTMGVRHTKRGQAYYRCQKRTGRAELLNNHDVAALVYKADFLVWEKVKEMVTHPSLVRERIDQLRSQHTTVLGKEEIEASIASLQRQMSNLFKLAQNATDDQTID